MDITLYSEINDAKYLYVTRIYESDEDDLEFEITIPGSGQKDNLVIKEVELGEVTPIIYNQYSPRYKVVFKSYIPYSVVNESYANINPDDIYTGKLFRIYQKSAFLDYTGIETFATHGYPGPFRHYQIVALDHIVNVASVDEPVIEKLIDANP